MILKECEKVESTNDTSIKSKTAKNSITTMYTNLRSIMNKSKREELLIRLRESE